MWILYKRTNAYIIVIDLNKIRKEKTKIKVWKNIDEVVKATIEIPKKIQWIVEVMEEVPKGEKSNF